LVNCYWVQLWKITNGCNTLAWWSMLVCDWLKCVCVQLRKITIGCNTCNDKIWSYAGKHLAELNVFLYCHLRIRTQKWLNVWTDSNPDWSANWFYHICISVLSGSEPKSLCLTESISKLCHLNLNLPNLKITILHSF